MRERIQGRLETRELHGEDLLPCSHDWDIERVGKPPRVPGQGLIRCAECGGEVKVMVSPRRNPHSNKLGRAVSMKDHDLCRRCWRRAVHRSRQGVVVPLEEARLMRAVRGEDKAGRVVSEPFAQAG